MFRYQIGLFIVSILAALATLSDTLATSEREYAGSETCAGCHAEISESYSRSGHPLKIQKVDGAPPVFPQGTSSGVFAPPAGTDWEEISYVIGGYGWKARFMDRDGYILTGEENRQFNLANDQLGTAGGWTGYDPKTAPRKPYTCGDCHTTGWRATGPDGPHQDGLPGIHGVWQEPGVTCEACHGPGASHVANPAQISLSTEANCQACHVRGDVEKIDAKGGLVRHHEQYEDLLASPHMAVGCLACHDPHKSTKYGLGGFKGQSTCLDCHQQETVAVAPKAHSTCTSCHMPYTGKSAVSVRTAYEGGTLPRGDIRSHIFRIQASADWNMFTDDGKFVRIDGLGRAALSLEYSCLGCHANRDKTWAAGNAGGIHAGR